MTTVVLWFLVLNTQATPVFFPHEFATQAKCEQAKRTLGQQAKCFEAEIVVPRKL